MPSRCHVSSRRRFLVTSATAFAAAPFILRGASPQAHIKDTRVISVQPDYYHGWPTVARRSNGELILVWSGRREAHVCPFGTVEMMRSKDDGATWTWPQTLLDGPLDDRDAGVLETARGTLLVTTFTSLAYEPSLTKVEALKAGDKGAWEPQRLKAWQAARDRINATQRQAELGQWMLRSTDGGITWSPRYSSIVNSPHGPIQRRNGRLLYAGKELWTEEKRVGVCESRDDGRTWKWLAEIRPREGDTVANYHELHAVETLDDTLIVHIRNHNKANVGETLQCESHDGGRTWSVPRSIGAWGLPSHLLRLRDGRLLMTYGHRRKPFGNQARISVDHGRSWSEPMIVSGDGVGGDLGYPSTVELADGDLLTVWYERMADNPKAVLRQARWRV